MKLDPHETLGKNMLLIKYIGPFQHLAQETDGLDQFVDFHVHLCIHHLDILRVERALKSITFVSDAEVISSEEGTPSPMFDIEHRSDLSVHVVNKLYDFVCRLTCSQMKDWLVCFRKVVSYAVKHCCTLKL